MHSSGTAAGRADLQSCHAVQAAARRERPPAPVRHGVGECVGVASSIVERPGPGQAAGQSASLLLPSNVGQLGVAAGRGPIDVAATGDRRGGWRLEEGILIDHHDIML